MEQAIVWTHEELYCVTMPQWVKNQKQAPVNL